MTSKSNNQLSGAGGKDGTTVIKRISQDGRKTGSILKKNVNNGGSVDDDPSAFPWKSDDEQKNITKYTIGIPAMISHWARPCLRSMFSMVVVLYILNQKHLLPKPLSAVVSETLFWPTIPITISRRINKWITTVDDTVLIGGAPFGFANYPETLYDTFNVRGVINMCKEYKGPETKYKKLGIKHLRLPTVDHFEPSIEDYEKAVLFIEKHKTNGSKVYVHCRAGHGRSAATVFAWLLYLDPKVDREKLNQEFCKIRNVRSTLWKQPNIIKFHEKLKRGEINSQ